ncbi:MAG: hypothetical protein ACP5IE_08695 [Infirmifilum sp.]
MRKRETKLVTILWHDNSIMIKVGRVYPALLESLAELKDTYVLKGVNAHRMIKERRMEE